MRWGALVLALWAGCVKSHSVQCEAGLVCPEATLCDDLHRACIKPQQLTSCEAVADGIDCTIRSENDGVCDQGVCLEKRCGDHHVSTGEDCDGELSGPLSCNNFGFYSTAKPVCNTDCTYNLTTCEGFCGNHVVDGSEICEADIPPTATCLDYGFSAGNLGCNAGCGPLTSDCETFNWQATSFGVTGALGDIHGLASNDVYAILGGQLIHYDGAAWTKVSLSGCAGGTLKAVFESSKDVVWAAGDDGVVLRWTPTSCTQWTTSFNQSLNDVFATSDTDAWVASSQSGVYRFNGTDWSQSSVGTPIRQVWGSGPSDVYATLISNFGDGTMIHWDGGAWSGHFFPGTVQKALAVFGTSSSNVYVAGFDASNNPMIVNGSGTSFTTSLPPPAAFGTTATGQVTSGWAVGSRILVEVSAGTTYLAEYDGVGWNNLHTPQTQVTSHAFMTADGTVFSSFGAGAGMGVILPRNLHATYTSAAAGGYPRLAARAGNDVFMGGDGVYHFDGATWSPITAGLNPTFDLSRVAPPSGVVFAGGSGGLQRITGNVAAPPDSSVGIAVIVAAVGPNEAWVSDNATVKQWTTSGTTNRPLPGNAAVTDLWAASATAIFAVGPSGSIFKWTGAAWTPLSSGTTTGLTAVTGIAENDVYAAGLDTLLHYDGAVWTSIAVPTNLGNVTDMALQAPDDLFIASSSGLFHYDGTQVTPVDTSSLYSIATVSGAGDSTFFCDGGKVIHQLVRLERW